MNIDLVYLWCNGNDPVWMQKRDSYMPSADRCRRDVETFSKGRIANSDELKYSLRSVEMYAPWINHIYIVTDNQIPSWLDVNNPKVTIVDHTDILPKEALPNFNSTAIEMGIANIEGLSEYFLYANDDMMFGRKVDPTFFISGAKINCRFLSGAVHDRETTYFIKIANVERTISEDFGVDMYRKQQIHNIELYSKSVVRECVQRYSEWVKLTMSHKFRSKDDIQRHIFSLYAVATGRGRVVFSSKKEPKNRWIKSLFGRYKGLDAMVADANIISIASKRIKRLKPALVCFNDNQHTTDANRLQLKKVLNKFYPKKSSFEL